MVGNGGWLVSYSDGDLDSSRMDVQDGRVAGAKDRLVRQEVDDGELRLELGDVRDQVIDVANDVALLNVRE